MGRSKEYGKPVAELTHDELLRCKVQCQRFLQQPYCHPVAKKSAQKRLRDINKRLADDKERS